MTKTPTPTESLEPKGIWDLMAGLTPGTTFSTIFDRVTYLICIDHGERRFPHVIASQQTKIAA